jgi:NADH dehydrogenase
MGPLTTEAREASRVLVLGGGYVALTLTRGLNREIERDTLHATVVSRDNYHVYHGLIGEMLTGRIAPGNVLSPARRIFGRASVHVAEVEKIDLERRVVLTNTTTSFCVSAAARTSRPTRGSPSTRSS